MTEISHKLMESIVALQKAIKEIDAINKRYEAIKKELQIAQKKKSKIEQEFIYFPLTMANTMERVKIGGRMTK